MQNLSAKITKTQLQYILNVSYPTARKEYSIILDSLQLKRNFLVVQDLYDYGVLKFPQNKHKI